MDKNQTVVIIGGGAGGMTTATQLKRQSPNTEVIVIDKGPYVSWAGCPTPYYISGKLPFKSVVHYSVDYFLEKRKIKVLTEHIAQSIDLAYSPTTSVVWNPLLAAYRKIKKR